MIKYLWPSILWSITILVLTLIPGEELPEVPIFGIDKVVHFFIFGLLMFVTAYGLLKSHIRHSVLISLVYSISFGIMIELIQPFIPGRNFSYFDILANVIGVAIGYGCFRYLRSRLV